MAINIDAPKLDDVIDPNELLDFAANCTRLSRYAVQKANAIRWRSGGHTLQAREAERRAKALYNGLPPEWRW